MNLITALYFSIEIYVLVITLHWYWKFLEEIPLYSFSSYPLQALTQDLAIVFRDHLLHEQMNAFNLHELDSFIQVHIFPEKGN